MNRQRVFLYVFAGLVLAAIGAAYVIQRRQARVNPDWTDAGQPPEGVAAQMTTLTDGEMRAVYGVPHLSAGCSMYTARPGYALRDWPGHLADCADSLIRAEFSIGGA